MRGCFDAPPYEGLPPSSSASTLHFGGRCPEVKGRTMTQTATFRRAGRSKRLILIAGALLLAGLLAIPASSIALASLQPQAPSGADLTLVNQGAQVVERKKKGHFVARPLFSRQVDVLYYAVRHPDTGEWLTAMYRVMEGEKERKEGWEYSFEYPDEHSSLDPELPYLLVLLAGNEGEGDLHTFHAGHPGPPARRAVGPGVGGPESR